MSYSTFITAQEWRDQGEKSIFRYSNKPYLTAGECVNEVPFAKPLRMCGQFARAANGKGRGRRVIDYQ